MVRSRTNRMKFSVFTYADRGCVMDRLNCVLKSRLLESLREFSFKCILQH